LPEEFAQERRHWPTLYPLNGRAQKAAEVWTFSVRSTITFGRRTAGNTAAYSYFEIKRALTLSAIFGLA
jgi:hypothetical protein